MALSYTGKKPMKKSFGATTAPKPSDSMTFEQAMRFLLLSDSQQQGREQKRFACQHALVNHLERDLLEPAQRIEAAGLLKEEHKLGRLTGTARRRIEASEALCKEVFGR